MDLFTNPDLFRVIDEYTDLRSLCDTCTLLLQFKKYITYKLNRDYSLMYYNDILFRQRVLNKIFNPYKQLHLDLSDCNITDVSALNNVHTLNLRNCYKITDVSALGNVHTLDLFRCYKITDVSALGNVYDLDLTYCGDITDVSALGKVNTLDLSNCKQITDVSALGNVHILDLRECNQLTDVSASNVHTLDLRECNQLTDVTALRNVNKLILP